MVTFAKLWESYPDVGGPCSTDGKRNFENQCAIRMGVCLENAGVNTKEWPVRRCWQHKGKERHILAAEELANALARHAVPGVGRVEKYGGKEGFEKIRGRTGIVFFMNYTGVSMQGDHIDLWNRVKTTNRVASFFEIQLMAGGKYVNGNIWFWQVI